jgi:hypothetical protein
MNTTTTTIYRVNHTPGGSYTERVTLAAADDFLRATETGTASIKSRRWLNDPATMKQMDLLQRAGHEANGLDFSLSKYAANCHLNFLWNRAAIQRSVLGAAARVAA